MDEHTADPSAISKALLDKSQEAFLLSVELYNRPTIRYHVEGCAFFLCNAWELMLKAHLIERDGLDSIYYADKPDRTITLEECLRRVSSNDADPMRRNMDKVISLRNTSTHFVVQEYEYFYAPILQACVQNYDDQLRKLHGMEISDRIPENYLVLSVKRADVDADECRARYDPTVLHRMLAVRDGIDAVRSETDSPRFSMTYVTELRSTKKADADLTFRIAGDGETPVAVVKQLANPKDKYPYRMKTAVDEVCRRISRAGLTLLQDGVDTRERSKSGNPFNAYHFGLFRSCYSFIGDPRFSYDTALEGEQSTYTYSQQAIDLIWDRIKENPAGVLDDVRRGTKK